MNHRPTTSYITHIGGPTARIELGPFRLLTDPTFDPAGSQYGSPPRVLTKTADPALPASAIGPLDAILLSHDHHADNLDPAGRALFPQAAHILTTPAGAQRLNLPYAQGLAPWQTTTLTSPDGQRLRITATPARHGPDAILPTVGEVTGWLLQWDAPDDPTLYISGDTIYFDELAQLGQRYRITTALLNCGAASLPAAYGSAHLTLTALEAAHLARALPHATIIPLHYEGWAHFSQGRADLEHAFTTPDLAPRLHILPIGQRIPLPA